MCSKEKKFDCKKLKLDDYNYTSDEEEGDAKLKLDKETKEFIKEINENKTVLIEIDLVNILASNQVY